jgi:putative transcriptional regulator
LYFVKGLFEKIEKFFRGFKMEFSERLKKLRKDTGLTQVDVANKLGISQQAYASWERGIKKPTQENLVKLSKILYVSVDYLLGNTENKQTSDVLENIEILFRMNSEGLTEDEKAVFKKELIEFMEKRKEAFEKNK